MENPIYGKIRGTGTASFVVQLFNNATAGGIVNLNVSS
jgi:hypothetical protein